MSHINRGNVSDLASARLNKTAKPGDTLRQKALVCADLMCKRLASIYGGPVTLQSLEPDGPLQYTVRLSCEWGNPPNFVHRVAIIRLHPDGEVDDIQVKEL